MPAQWFRLVVPLDGASVPCDADVAFVAEEVDTSWWSGTARSC
jgi:hypothetical protein